MENRKITSAQIQRSQLAVVGLNNVSIVDTRVNKLNNNYQDYVDILRNTDCNAPIFGSAIQAKAVTAGNALAFAQANITTDDQVVIIMLPNTFSPAILRSAIAGLLITEKYMEFSQGGIHAVEIIPMIGQTVDTVNRRILSVEPTAGVNTVAEYVVLPTVQPFTLGPVINTVYQGGTAPIPEGYSKSAGNYMTPWPLDRPFTVGGDGGYSAILVAFKGMAGEGILSVTPIFTGVMAATQISEILNS